MADTILENAKRRLAEAQAEVDRWDGFIAMYRELSTGTAPASDASVAHASELPRRVRLAVVPPGGSKAGSTLAVTERAAIEILQEVGHPLPTATLRPLLEERGIEIGGKDPNSTLSARLSRAPGIVNDRVRGWYLKELADGNDASRQMPSAMVERQDDDLTEPQAEGREAVPGGGT